MEEPSGVGVRRTTSASRLLTLKMKSFPEMRTPMPFRHCPLPLRTPMGPSTITLLSCHVGARARIRVGGGGADGQTRTSVRISRRRRRRRVQRQFLIGCGGARTPPIRFLGTDPPRSPKAARVATWKSSSRSSDVWHVRTSVSGVFAWFRAPPGLISMHTSCVWSRLMAPMPPKWKYRRWLSLCASFVKSTNAELAKSMLSSF